MRGPCRPWWARCLCRNTGCWGLQVGRFVLCASQSPPQGSPGFGVSFPPEAPWRKQGYSVHRRKEMGVHKAAFAPQKRCCHHPPPHPCLFFSSAPWCQTWEVHSSWLRYAHGDPGRRHPCATDEKTEAREGRLTWGHTDADLSPDTRDDALNPGQVLKAVMNLLLGPPQTHSTAPHPAEQGALAHWTFTSPTSFPRASRRDLGHPISCECYQPRLGNNQPSWPGSLVRNSIPEPFWPITRQATGKMENGNSVSVIQILLESLLKWEWGLRHLEVDVTVLKCSLIFWAT